MTDDRLTGYATENVERLSPQYEAELQAFVRVVIPHDHDGYGWQGCAMCRRTVAEARYLGGKAYEGDVS